MPNSRHPDRVLASFWMHRDIHTALEIVTKVGGVTKTQYILEALGEKMGFSLDEAGSPVGLDLEGLARHAVSSRKRPGRKRAS